MLVLSRSFGDGLLLCLPNSAQVQIDVRHGPGDSVHVEMDVRHGPGGSVRLLIGAPREVSVSRAELLAAADDRLGRPRSGE